ncbi:MAG: bacterial Ig-like domain-containing protein [Clostridia bacterium]
MKIKKIVKSVCLALLLCVSTALTFSACTNNQTKAITSIELKQAPTKTTYSVGEQIDPAGGELTVTYEDQTTEKFGFVGTEGLTVALQGNQSLSFPEQRTVVATYKSKTCTFTIDVNPEATGVLVNSVETLNTALADTAKTTIYLANGTYQYAQININRAVKLVGQSASGTIITKPATGNESHVLLSGSEVNMNNISFKGNKLGSGLWATGSQVFTKFILKNVNISEYTYGIYLSDGTSTTPKQNLTVEEITFENVNSSNNENYGAYIGRIPTKGMFTNCNMSFNKERGLTLCTLGGGSSYNVIISGGTFDNNGGGVVGNRGIHLCLDHYITEINYNKTDVVSEVLVKNVTAQNTGKKGATNNYGIYVCGYSKVNVTVTNPTTGGEFETKGVFNDESQWSGYTWTNGEHAKVTVDNVELFPPAK